MKNTLKKQYAPFAAQLQEFKQDNHIRVVHFFNKYWPQGGATVAYRPILHDSKGNPRGRFAEVSVAYCNPEDRYDRKLGELIALDAMGNGRAINLPVYIEGHPVRYLRNMFDNIEYNF